MLVLGILLVASFADSATGSAPSDERRAVADHVRERVASVAEFATSVPPSDTFSAQDILSLRNDLKMARVDADAVAAQVVKDQTGWDWPNKEFVGQSVSKDRCATVAQYPVAVVARVGGALPDPTVITLADLGPESFCQGAANVRRPCFWHQVSLVPAHPWLTRLAQDAPEGTSGPGMSRDGRVSEGILPRPQSEEPE